MKKAPKNASGTYGKLGNAKFEQGPYDNDYGVKEGSKADLARDKREKSAMKKPPPPAKKSVARPAKNALAMAFKAVKKK